jgi:hypothetical protein
VTPEPRPAQRSTRRRALLGLLGLAVTVFGLKQGYAEGGEQIIQGLLTIFGASPLAVAAGKTNQQVKNGTFDAPPPMAEIVQYDPARNVIDNVKAVQDQFAEFTESIQDGLTKVQGVAGMVGALNPLVQDFLNRGGPEKQ